MNKFNIPFYTINDNVYNTNNFIDHYILIFSPKKPTVKYRLIRNLFGIRLEINYNVQTNNTTTKSKYMDLL